MLLEGPFRGLEIQGLSFLRFFLCLGTTLISKQEPGKHVTGTVVYVVTAGPKVFLQWLSKKSAVYLL